MHGGWSNETTLLDTPGESHEFKHTLYHAIQDGKIESLIVICRTNNNTSGKDSGDYSLALELTDLYHQELVNDLIPAVESQYSSYAEDTTSCAYWGFVLISLHLGLHWSMMRGMARKGFPGLSSFRKWIARIAGAAIAGYGFYAFIKRKIGSYMLMQVHFVFFNYEEPVIFFLLDYMAAMALFVFVGHYFCEVIKKKGMRKYEV